MMMRGKAVVIFEWHVGRRAVKEEIDDRLDATARQINR